MSATPRLSDRVYAVERRIVAWAGLAMGLVVFLDVIHRVASRERGLFVRVLGDDNASWAAPLGSVVTAALFLVAAYAAVVIRGGAPGLRSFAKAFLVVVALGVAVRLFVWLLPNGLVWSQTLGLVIMLWIGMLGASMATRDHRHLALDLGSKVWPKRVLPIAQGAGNLITALFCFVLAALAVISLRDHFGDWRDTDGAGGTFVALPLPKWLAFVIMPAGFAMMGARFLLLALEGLRGQVEEDDPLRLLGLDQRGEQAEGK